MKIGKSLVLLLLNAPLWAQYAGPAILSRGEAPAAMSLPRITFHPFLESSAVYQDGLGAVTINSNGQLGNIHAFGTALTWGIGGVHSWRHTKLGLDYRGTITHYFNGQGFDGLDQSLMLGVSHQLSPHTSFDFRETAGMTNRNFGQRGLRETVPFDPSTTYAPTTDYFDNRTIYSTTQGMMQFQKSSRLSFVMGGNAFAVRRRSDALFDSTGLTAKGDAEYRVSRRGTIGLTYSYLHFTYGTIAGATDAHGVTGGYSVRMTRNSELSAYGGFYRIESTFLQQSHVDPVIAALLGITTVPQLVYHKTYTPQFGARLSRAYHKGMFFIAAGRSVTPGNGVFVTSLADNVMSGYSYTGLRRWGFGAMAGYTRADSIGTITGGYSSSEQGMQISRELSGHLHFIASVSARQYRSPDYSNYNRNVTDARISLGYSPGDIPLRIW